LAVHDPIFPGKADIWRQDSIDVSRSSRWPRSRLGVALPNLVPLPPASPLVKVGQLTTCTGLPYEPFEFEQDGKVVGLTST
jgi:hypothetical protein